MFGALAGLVLIGGCSRQQQGEMGEEATATAGTEQAEQMGETQQTSSTRFEQTAQGDQRITVDELRQGMEEYYYSGWDYDADGDMDYQEVSNGLYTAMDTDGDGIVEQSEWEAGMAVWMPSQVTTTNFEDWDEDGNLELTTTEFNEGMTKTRLWDTYDANDGGVIEADEVTSYVHTEWDIDRDGFVDYEEWKLED